MLKAILSCVIALSFTAIAAEPAKPAAPVCAKDGKPASPGVMFAYEGCEYPLCSAECKDAFEAGVKGSIYHRIGGKPSMEAAVGIFYKKMLADDRVKQFFEGVNMKRQAEKQMAFLSAALGSPVKWAGLDMRTAHADLKGLNDAHFNAVAENLQATLVELKVPDAVIKEIMTIADSVRPEVLNKKPAAK